jgi:hypothetical protein
MELLRKFQRKVTISQSSVGIFQNHAVHLNQIWLHWYEYQLLLDRSPNIGPFISRWELDKFENCWNKRFRTFKIQTLLYHQFPNLIISQRDMSGPRSGALSNNRWSGGTAQRTLVEGVCSGLLGATCPTISHYFLLALLLVNIKEKAGKAAVGPDPRSTYDVYRPRRIRYTAITVWTIITHSSQQTIPSRASRVTDGHGKTSSTMYASRAHKRVYLLYPIVTIVLRNSFFFYKIVSLLNLQVTRSFIDSFAWLLHYFQE